MFLFSTAQRHLAISIGGLLLFAISFTLHSQKGKKK